MFQNNEIKLEATIYEIHKQVIVKFVYYVHSERIVREYLHVDCNPPDIKEYIRFIKESKKRHQKQQDHLRKFIGEESRELISMLPTAEENLIDEFFLAYAFVRLHDNGIYLSPAYEVAKASSI